MRKLGIAVGLAILLAAGVAGAPTTQAQEGELQVDRLCEQGRAEFHYSIMGSSIYLAGQDAELKGASLNHALSAVPEAKSKLDTLSWARWVALFVTSPIGMAAVDYFFGSQAVDLYNMAYEAHCTEE